jgi:hypothetical protein
VTQVLLLQAERTKERFKQVLIFLFSLVFFYKYGTCHLSKKKNIWNMSAFDYFALFIRKGKKSAFD